VSTAPASLVLPRPTARLVLRPVSQSDGVDLLDYRSREDVNRYLQSDPMREDEVAPFIDERHAATTIAGDHDRIFLVLEHEGRVVGDLSLRVARLLDAQAEIGWVLHPDVRGRGLATEAAACLVDAAFDELGMHRVFAQLDPRNTSSAALCARLGMRQEALLREESWFKGEWGDLAVYATLRREWRAHRRAV
jgi:RimJ/RimL family protein N-acetyltransferase